MDVTISYTCTFSTNGAITAITLEEISDSAVTSDVGSGRLELTSLPLGDDKHSSSPQQGYIYSCTTNFGRGGGAFNTGPWIDEDAGTYDMTGKVFVDGSNTWSNAYITISDDGSTRYIQANGLPTNHGTGDYPVESTDDAYNYDRNPNSVTEQNASYSFPLNPTIANQATCVSSGAIAVSLNGVVIFNGFDLLARDAVAYEIQDVCDGHPERTGEYHYHSSSACFEDVLDSDGHSSLFAYAFDGFGLYGKQSGGEYVTNSDLDECHGHSHTIDEDNDMYHYHLTDEFPYTIGCYRGTP